MSNRAGRADDEQLARDELCFLLGKIEGVEVVAQAVDGVQALDDISRLGPDVAFLDVQMPGLTGFEVARRLLEHGTDMAVVFVTAFDHRAVEAFEVNAVDYVLKPVDPAGWNKLCRGSGGGGRDRRWATSSNGWSG